MKKKMMSVFIIFMVLFLSLSISFADELNDAQNKLSNSKDKIEGLKDKIGDVKDEKDDVLSQIYSLDKQVNSLQSQLNTISSQISSKQSQIKQTTTELNKAIDDYNKQQDLYAKRIRAMYMNGPSGYIEILFSSESFSDMISRMDMVKKVMEYDKQVINEIKDKQQKIEAQKKQLESENTQLVQMQNDIAGKKTQVASMNLQKKDYYSALAKNEVSLEAAMEDEESTAQKLQANIQQIIASRANSRGGSTYSGTRGPILKVSDIGRIPPITCPFGMRVHPITHVYKLHTGMDIGISTGTPVYAMSSGTVIISQYYGAFGNAVVIDHGSGVTSLYAHNSQLLVSSGQHVEKGQMISRSGSTGYSTGPHLHFEIDINGQPVDPAPYYIIGQ